MPQASGTRFADPKERIPLFVMIRLEAGGLKSVAKSMTIRDNVRWQFAQGVKTIWHSGWLLCFQNPKNDHVMLSLRYLKLKRAATRLMAAGDLTRYMHALRLMHTLRSRNALAV
jgi:hypothetical protein